MTCFLRCGALTAEMLPKATCAEPNAQRQWHGSFVFLFVSLFVCLFVCVCGCVCVCGAGWRCQMDGEARDVEVGEVWAKAD